MSVLSIQSHVATGRVGNSIVAFALQRLGVEVWPVHTVLFSNHPGHGPFRGKRRAPEDLAEIIQGLEEHGAFTRCRAVLSGYLGAHATGDVVLEAVARVRRASPDALFFLDPVMGDDGKGLYVPEDLVSFYTKAAREADVLAPNAFELGVLTGQVVDGVTSAAAAAAKLLQGRTRLVFVTSVPGSTTERMATLAVTGDRVRGFETPRLALDPKGAGDLFMALAATHMLTGEAADAALEKAVRSVWSLSERAADGETSGGDLPVLSHQDVLIAPPVIPGAEPIVL